jgi:ubiquinone/menaquinone biosynthesis C-methylase UbiE
MKEVKEYYDEKSESYDRAFDNLYFRVFDAITWKYLEPYVPTDSKALVLDAGGGTGRWSIRMAEKGCKVVLMDSSDGMQRVAAQKVKKANLQHRISLKRGDIIETDYGNETFDMILCEHALFLFKSPDAAIRELVRVLKKEGCLIISAQNRYVQSMASLSGKPSPNNVERAFKTLVARHYECMSEDGKVKIYTWTPQEFRKMLESNGLYVEKIVGKCVTMPLRIRKETYLKKDYPQELFDRILEYELALCEKSDALALAGHLQAVTRKTSAS